MVSPVVIGTNAQGAVVRQSPSQLVQEYQNAAAIGVTATRVYDAAGLCGTQSCGAVTLAAANTVGMMGARAPPPASQRRANACPKP